MISGRLSETWLGLLAMLLILGTGTSADAGKVTAVVEEGLLQITGSTSADKLIVISTPQQSAVIALVGTRLDNNRLLGGKLQVFGPVSGVVFRGIDGDDRFIGVLATGTMLYVGGPGNEQVFVEAAVSSSINIQTGLGNDIVSVGSAVEGTPALVNELQVGLGDGDNDLVISSVSAGSLTLNGGNNIDDVLLDQLTGLPVLGMTLNVNLGGADDNMAFTASNILVADEMVPPVLDGGEGFDRLQLLQISGFSVLPTYLNFEEISTDLPPPPDPVGP